MFLLGLYKVNSLGERLFSISKEINLRVTASHYHFGILKLFIYLLRLTLMLGNEKS